MPRTKQEIKLTTDERQACTVAFRNFDRDGSGTIDSKELKQVWGWETFSAPAFLPAAPPPPPPPAGLPRPARQCPLRYSLHHRLVVSSPSLSSPSPASSIL